MSFGRQRVFVTGGQTSRFSLAFRKFFAKRHRVVPTREIHRQVVGLVGQIFANVDVARHSHKIADGRLPVREIVERVVVYHVGQMLTQIRAHHVAPLGHGDFRRAHPISMSQRHLKLRFVVAMAGL